MVETMFLVTVAILCTPMTWILAGGLVVAILADKFMAKREKARGLEDDNGNQS